MKYAGPTRFVGGRFKWPGQRGYKKKHAGSDGRGYYGRFKRAANVGNRELKFHDLVVDDAAIATGATIVTDSVLEIAQGAGESQRIGRKIIIKKIGWRYEIRKLNSTGPTDGDDVIRIVLYLDKQANGLTAATTDILETANYQSFNNLANRGRFRILFDKTVAMNIEAGAGDGTTNVGFIKAYQGQFYKNCNIPVEYSAAAGAITSINSNNIGVMLLSRSGVCFFGSQMRIRFSDY